MADSKARKFKTDIEYRIHRLKLLADKYGWKLLSEHKISAPKNIFEFESVHNWGFITDSKVLMRINYFSLEVETFLNHPSKGETQLRRKGEFSMNLIEKIFRNPRVHMPSQIKGVYVQK